MMNNTVSELVQKHPSSIKVVMFTYTLAVTITCVCTFLGYFWPTLLPQTVLKSYMLFASSHLKAENEKLPLLSPTASWHFLWINVDIPEIYSENPEDL